MNQTTETNQRDVQEDYKYMDLYNMFRRVFTCKKCGERKTYDIFSTSTVEQKWYVNQLFITKRCPKCYAEMMRGEEE